MSSSQGLSGILPPEMEANIHDDRNSSPSEWSHSAAGDTSPYNPDRIPNNNNTRAHLAPGFMLQSTIRAVTPDPTENGSMLMGTSIPSITRGFGATSPQKSSPRSIPGGERRRQGRVFPDEVFSDSFDSSSPSPPPQRGASRPRTRTMDEALALRQVSTTVPKENRARVGSYSSSSSQPLIDNDVRPPPIVLETAAYGTLAPSRPSDPRSSTVSTKDRKPSSRRLVKRGSSRPTSPIISPPPSVDSLPLPIPTDDANRMLSLMKRLCGRMKGEVEYQSDPSAPWYRGVCYIDEDRGSLMFDPGHDGPFHLPLIGDLRGCRVLPCKAPDGGSSCLELYSAKMGVELLLRPLIPDEIDHWLASLLCWQQIRPPGVRLASGRGPSSPGPGRSEARKRGSSVVTPTFKDPAIIKVGNVMLWDKGIATSPRAIVKRPSTRDLRSGSTSWRRVSCILQDNGEFKLMTENDVTVLSVIDLTQLLRSAVQKLDRSVLEEEFCIAVFPIYSPTSKQLSIFRPVYLALDSRVLFEVWFVLLKAFAIPDLYGIEASTGQIVEIQDLNAEFDGQVFRIEKSIQVKVTEAKIYKAITPPERHHPHHKERDGVVGHYLAEVILDGEVRSRTASQTDMRNPFWRETAQFSELPTTLPYLSVILKRLDGNLDTFSHQIQASLGLPKLGNLTEVVCGVVEVPLDKMEKGKDHEQWYQVYDEKQESVGSMFIKVEHDETVVLTNQDYQPLAELLHRFSSGLTSQITQSTPGMSRRLAETFLNIFQVSGTASEWLMALVEDEIDGVGNQSSMKKLRFSRRMKSNDSSTSASDREQLVRDMSKSLTGEANLLFRGNTLLTQALESHMRRLGKEYLEDILGDKIFEINEINPDCEVDPCRIEKVEDLQQHWGLLIQLTTELWEIIARSANKLPLELRGVLKYVRAVAEDRYGDFLRTVNYTSVSGFLFLRFICPAILNPKLFGLLRDNPRPRAQRTLTLIAKGLQALANLSQFGKKESWMEPMNKFLGGYRQSFKNYIDQLCSVSPDRNPITVPASYSTPIMILGRLSPRAREGFPSLPYLIDHQRNFAALVKLWLESHHASAADSQIFEGELGEFHTLCVELQRRSDNCLAQVEMMRAMENESVFTDDLTEGLEKASLMESLKQSYASSAVWTDNDPYRPPGSSGSEADGADKATQRHYSRESSSLRQTSDGLDFSNPMATIRARNKSGKDARSFLSGLIGTKKSKEHHLNISSTVREKSRGKDDKGSRGILGNFPESWQQNDTNSRH
ncbi:Rho GTPase activation protein [Xylariaceae sp. FL1651]|nr:Rho GTPase activation protein [Xylariaceae sp. FL1651]